LFRRGAAPADVLDRHRHRAWQWEPSRTARGWSRRRRNVVRLQPRSRTRCNQRRHRGDSASTAQKHHRGW